MRFLNMTFTSIQVSPGLPPRCTSFYWVQELVYYDGDLNVKNQRNHR